MVHVRRLSLWIAVLAFAVLAVHGQPTASTAGPERSANGSAPSGRVDHGPGQLDRFTATHAGPDDGSGKVRTLTVALGAAFAAAVALLTSHRTLRTARSVPVRRRPTGPWRGRAPPVALRA